MPSRTVIRSLTLLVAASTTAALSAIGAPAYSAVQTPTISARTAADVRFANQLAQVRQRAVLRLKAGAITRTGPNPALALVPDESKLDRAGWARTGTATAAGATTRRGKAAAAGTPVATKRLAVSETEESGSKGQNDTAATAQSLPLGTSNKLYQGIDLSGHQAPDPLPATVSIPPNTEDDSSLETARVTGVSDQRGSISTTGFIGDAPPRPDGTRPDDADLYAMDLKANQLVTVPLQTTSGNLIPLLIVVDADGNFLADSFFDSDLYNPTLRMSTQKAGRYYLVVVGFTLLSDEFTGPTTGDYSLQLSARDGDVDAYQVNLAAGDVLGVTVSNGARNVAIRDASGGLAMASNQDASFIYPTASPLPGGGNATADLVAPTSGKYTVFISGGDGPYTAMLEAYRPGGTKPIQQTIFLDLNGQRLNTGIFGGRGVTTLSPLDSFLSNWGLTPADRPALVAAITANVTRAVRADLVASGLSKSVAVKVVTSDDTKDTFGTAGVSRVIVGGTIQESGVPTIGIAQSIDPGNFAREESALVLLDLLSEPGNADEAPYSLNSYLQPSSNRVAFVAQGLGNVIAHEIGHTIGNFHTDNANDQSSLMDAGGLGFGTLFGVGPDGVGGTADDAHVAFVTDEFAPWEGFSGQENTLARSTWGLSR